MSNELALLKNEVNGISEGRRDIALALGKSPEDKSVSKYILGAIKEIEGKTTLQACSAQSIINCLIQCANLGLAVDNRKLAYLVPFGGQCTLMPGYLGYIHTIKRADPNAFIVVEIVRTDDVFECATQNGQAVYRFVPKNPFDDSNNNIKGVFCYIKTDNGSSLSLMTKAELDKVQSCSKMKSGGVWSTWYLEMLKKSAVRRACKLLFTEAVAKLNAEDDKYFNMSNKPQIATIAPSVPMPEPIQPEIAHEMTHEQAKEAELAQAPKQTENEPINEPESEQGILTFSGEVEAFSPAKGRKPAGILISSSWYNAPSDEVAELLATLKGQIVQGTYKQDGKYKVIETIGD